MPRSWAGKRRYTRPMNDITRTLIAAVLLATLAACGNKGPLIKPSQIPATQTPEEPAPQDATPVAPVAAPAAPVSDETLSPPPSEDDGDPGNG